MFLLIHVVPVLAKIADMIFTFHNVSINTDAKAEHIYEYHSFTFHNVSINTEISKERPPVHVIYIPQCFY